MVDWSRSTTLQDENQGQIVGDVGGDVAFNFVGLISVSTWSESLISMADRRKKPCCRLMILMCCDVHNVMLPHVFGSRVPGLGFPSQECLQNGRKRAMMMRNHLLPPVEQPWTHSSLRPSTAVRRLRVDHENILIYIYGPE